MSKKSNNKFSKRRLRKALNKSLDLIQLIRNGIHKTHYGSGVRHNSFGKNSNKE